MGLFGNILGQAAGGLGGAMFGGDPGQWSRIGGDVGGALLPFARGGVARPVPMMVGGVPMIPMAPTKKRGKKGGKKKGNKKK